MRLPSLNHPHIKKLITIMGIFAVVVLILYFFNINSIEGMSGAAGKPSTAKKPTSSVAM
jgi:hypothetical protein